MMIASIFADALEKSLAADGFASPDIAVAWLEEIERRLAAYDRGETSAVPANVSIDSIRQRLAAFRLARIIP